MSSFLWRGWRAVLRLLLREKAVRAASGVAVEGPAGQGGPGRAGSPVSPPPATPPQLPASGSRRVWEMDGGHSAPRDLGVSPGALQGSQQLRLEAAREELEMSLRELDEVTTALEVPWWGWGVLAGQLHG